MTSPGSPIAVFAERLAAAGALWSYDPANVRHLPAELLMEHTLLYADVPLIQEALALFGKQAMQQVWEQRILPDPRCRKLNYYLSRIWFDVPDMDAHLASLPHESRADKLRRLAASNP